MCQGVIFVFDTETGQYHWGIGSHSGLIAKMYKTASPKCYDRLVRVEAALGSGPGAFQIEGGHADDDQHAIFRDKLLDMAGTPQKLVAYLKQKVKEGFQWDESFLNVLTFAGQEKFCALTGQNDEEYRAELTAEQETLFDNIQDWRGGYDYRDSDIWYELRAGVYMVAKGLAKKVPTGDTLRKLIDKGRISAAKTIRKRAGAVVTNVLKRITDMDLVDEDLFVKGFVVSRIESALQAIANEYGPVNFLDDRRDAFDNLEGKELKKAEQLWQKHLDALEAKLPKRDPSDLDEVTAFAKVALDPKYLIPSWASALEDKKKGKKGKKVKSRK